MFYNNKKDLENLLKREIDSLKEGVFCVQSGHFALIHNKENNIEMNFIINQNCQIPIKKSF